MLRLFQICVLLGILFQLSLTQATDLAWLGWSDTGESTEHAQPLAALHLAVDAQDESSSRSSADDAADESTLASSELAGTWRLELASQTWKRGLARGRPDARTMFKPPRGSI